jgi:transcriptional regulator of acetoin/glycerol metabolism
LRAVLDISQLRSSQPKASQQLALQLVKLCANDIENAAFLHRHRSDWVLRLSAAPQFLDVQPDYLLALGASGRVVGHNRRAQLALFGRRLPAQPLLGRDFESLFDLPFNQLGRFVLTQPSDQRAVMLAGGQQLLFLSAMPAPPKPVAAVARQHSVPPALAALSGGDAALDRQIERLARLVNTPISLLITGETGSGKEVFAKAVHTTSERRTRPFVAVNCAAIPEHLIESELFGHLPGSFSGASPKGKRGLIMEADGGTLFLDEIGDMPLALQARLLRVLSEREVLPVGATRPLPVNIRVIAATHAPLELRVRQGRFRDDLYHRIKGAHIELPSLRARSDVAVMITRMLNGRTITPAALQRLLGHAWPGNLRELRNVLDYATSICREGPIEIDDMPELSAGHRVGSATVPVKAQDSDGPEALLQALRSAHWNVSAVARDMGLARMTLYRRMKRAGVVPPNRLN